MQNALPLFVLLETTILMECALSIVHLSGYKLQNLEGCNRTDAVSFKLPLSMKVSRSDKTYQTLYGKGKL